MHAHFFLFHLFSLQCWNTLLEWKELYQFPSGFDSVLLPTALPAAVFSITCEGGLLQHNFSFVSAVVGANCSWTPGPEFHCFRFTQPPPTSFLYVRMGGCLGQGEGGRDLLAGLLGILNPVRGSNEQLRGVSGVETVQAMRHVTQTKSLSVMFINIDGPIDAPETYLF